MARGGYIKLHRSITEWEWFQDANVYRLFTYLLILANTEDKRWQGIEIKRGELVTSSESLAKALNVGRSQVRIALKKLERSEITSKVTNKFTLIRIINYDLYQAKDNEAIEEAASEQPASQPTSNQQVTSRQPTSNQQVTTIKKHKKQEETKETEEEITPTPSSEVPYDEIVNAFNGTCTLMPKVSRITGARRRVMNARWRDYGKGEMKPFVDLFRRAAQSAFLNGENDRNWWADFDWLMNEQNLAKVLEGKYDRTTTRAAPSRPLSQQEENSRILRQMYEDAIREEQANGNSQGTDDPTLKPDKRGFPEQQVSDNRQPCKYVGILPRAL